MAIPIRSRIKNAWNIFRKKEEEEAFVWTEDTGPSYYYRPDRNILRVRHERTIVNAILNRMALDASSIDIKHVKLDADERYINDVRSDLNRCFNVEANIDQTGRAFKNDIFLTLLDKGTIAIVPTVVDYNEESDDPEYKIYEMRVGEIIEWRPKHVLVRLYDDRDGQKKEILLPKRAVAIVENPFYAVMNDTNSTIQRLSRKLNMLDAIDEQSSSGKLDLIIQLPYVVKSPKRLNEAEQRKADIASQLKNSQYGIAYIDGTEKITQLNRPVENNLLKQIEYLTNQAFSQLGLTEEILNGSADASIMQNYFARLIEPIVAAVSEEVNRKFISEKQRANNEALKYFRSPFKLIPVENVAEVADTFTRNAIMSSNEVRQIIGMKPSDNPEADELRNKNLSEPKRSGKEVNESELSSRISKMIDKKGTNQNG